MWIALALAPTAHATDWYGYFYGDVVLEDGDVVSGYLSAEGSIVLPAGVTVTILPPGVLYAKRVILDGDLVADGFGESPGAGGASPLLAGADGVSGGAGGPPGDCIHGGGGGGRRLRRGRR
jgi:hypothetical protein